MLSLPQSDKIEFDFSGKSHLICAENQAINIIYNKLKAVEYIPDNIQILQLGITEIELEVLNIKQFLAIENLQAELSKILNCAYMGLRFYAVGSERFVWNLRGYVRKLGLSEDEISIEVVDRQVRDIYCSNCRTINYLVNFDICTCNNCGIKLKTLEHFSNLKNAYLGICADAESL